ncbi:MAG TPA: transposase [Candidatus Acidoferrum sp.]|nr:transposase [Candidatus Acidoferrum sp.]
MKTAVSGMAEGSSDFGRTERFQEQSDYHWAVPAQRFARRGPVLPRPGTEHLLQLLQPRRRHDWALLAAIRDAYVSGAATRHVEAMARVVGVDGVSDDDVVRAGHELDRQLQAFRTRSVSGAYPYVVIDAIAQSVRQRGRLASLSAMVAVGVAATGNREVLAIEVDEAEEPVAWLRLLTGLRDRGVYGVRLVTAEAHPGIAGAIAQTFPAASFQRSRSGLIPDLLDIVPESDRPGLATQLRAVFVQDDRVAAQSLLRGIPNAFPSNPTLINDLRDREESILAFYDLPPPHRRRVNSARCLAHARGEIQRHCRLIGIFPYRLTLLRLCGVILQEQNDEWIAGPRYVGRRRDGNATTLGQPWTGLETDALGSRSGLRLVQAA